MARKKKKSDMNNTTIWSIIIVIAVIIFGYLYRDEIYNFFYPGSNIDVSGKFAVHFIDVGQGDSILIQSPENEFMLIDTGEGDQYDKLRSYFDHYKAFKFKYVIFTHPHSDHIGSASRFVQFYNIETLIMPNVTHTSKTFERLVTEIEKKNMKITVAKPGEKFNFGNAEFIILAPSSEEYGNMNNYSVVIKMTYGNTKFLFTGDMEKESENEVIAFCKNNMIDLSVDVLKVAHHGSSSSSQSSFLKLLEPSFAVIMCGKNNSYNHPNLKVADRIKSTDAEILRTDLDGDIVIISDGNNIEIKKGREAYVDYDPADSPDDSEYEKEKNEDYVEEE